MESRMTRGGSFIPKGRFFDLAGDHVQRYLWVSELMRGHKVLDAGCGHGYGSRYLLDSGASYVLGLDSDPDAIQFAIESYKLPNCESKLCDITKLDIAPASFDAVVSFEVIEHLVDVDGYLRGISQALKRGGLYVLSTPNKHYAVFFYRNGRSPSPFHIREYYPEELLELVKTNFSIDGLYVQFDKTLSDEQIGELHRRHIYGSNCPVPRSLQRFIPNTVQNLWLRHKHLPEIDSRDGKWKNYVIQKVDNPKEVDSRFETVLLSCRKI